MLEPKSLFDRIGGDYTINAIVDSFYGKVLSDDFMNPFFEGISLDAQMAKMKIFLKVGFGGASEGTIKHMGEAHVHLVERGLCDDHIDRMIEHMTAALKEVDIDDDLIAEVIEIVDGYRDEVLGRA